jgi:4'-phosphopantetheinyl transferase
VITKDTADTKEIRPHVHVWYAVTERLAESAMAETRDLLSPAECGTRFIELWTLKESYLKAIGAGLSNPLNDFGFELKGSSALVFNAPPGAARADWQFALFAPSTAHRMASAFAAIGRWTTPCGAGPPTHLRRTS